jgi:hypothetical protein
MLTIKNASKLKDAIDFLTEYPSREYFIEHYSAELYDIVLEIISAAQELDLATITD